MSLICLFDLDGVIVDTAKYHFTAWQRLADELGVPFDHADNDQLKGVSRVDSLEYILRKGNLELDNDTKVRLMDRKNEWYLAQVEAMQPDELFPGIVAFIDELRAAGVGVALGSSSKNAPLILDRCRIADRFDVIIAGNSNIIIVMSVIISVVVVIIIIITVSYTHLTLPTKA